MRRWAPVGLLAAGLAAFFALGLDSLVTFETLSRNREVLCGFVERHPFLSAGAYMIAYALAIAFSLPVGLVLTVTGGFLFGLAPATVLTVVSATIGALAVFLAARSAIGDTLRRRAGPFVARLEAGFRANALSYLLFLRLVPLFPFWLVNIVPALLGVPIGVFVVGTFFGIIPGTFVFVSVGSGLETVLDRGEVPGAEVFLEPGVLLPLLGLSALALVPAAYRWLRDRGRR